MLDAAHWPFWLHIVRLSGTFVITVLLGIHAYDCHIRESVQAVSPRKWMYWLYSMVFLLASLANFAQLCITSQFETFDRPTFHLGYSTLLLVLSYVTLLAGVGRRAYQK